MIFDLNYQRDLTETTNFEFAALRKTQISSFNLEGGNARLVSTGFAGRYGWEPSDGFDLGFSGDYQRLSFPVAVVAETTASGGVAVIEEDGLEFVGLKRRDNLYGLTFDASYRLGELIEAQFVYGYYRRTSVFPVFTYSGNRFAFVLQFGRQSERRGRVF